MWWEKQNLLWVCHNSRKKDRMDEDGTFLPHQTGTISTTLTSDWYVRKGENRDKLGECLKKTKDRSQDQWRMFQVLTHTCPSNYWRHKITKSEESDRCVSVTSAKFYGYQREGSSRTTIFLLKPGTYPTHMRNTLHNTHPETPPLLTPPTHRINSSLIL